MSTTSDLEFQSIPCIICEKSCVCLCKYVDHTDIDTDTNINQIEIITKGQQVLTNVLRTLRWSKSKTIINNDVTILNQEKCRPTISLREVAEHDSYDNCWIILYDRVYDVTNFLNVHPGGSEVIIEYGGRDASVAFRGHSQFALNSLKKYEIGELPEKERIYRKHGLLKCNNLPE